MSLSSSASTAPSSASKDRGFGACLDHSLRFDTKELVSLYSSLKQSVVLYNLHHHLHAYIQLLVLKTTSNSNTTLFVFLRNSRLRVSVILSLSSSWFLKKLILWFASWRVFEMNSKN